MPNTLHHVIFVVQVVQEPETRAAAEHAVLQLLLKSLPSETAVNLLKNVLHSMRQGEGDGVRFVAVVDIVQQHLGPDSTMDEVCNIMICGWGVGCQTWCRA